MKLGSVLLIVWFVIGAAAAAQRGYFGHDDLTCTGVGTTAVTVLAGPLNYLGVNPKVSGCDLPQPSE